VTETAADTREAQTPLPESPYKGLLPYTERDADFFFGRETEEELIVSNLLAARLTLLYGPSGVGKSSVLFAGVARELHSLAQEALEDEDRPRIVLVVLRDWHDDAARELERAVETAVRALLPDTQLEDVPPDRSLAGVLQHWCEQLGGRLLIVLDQFEEYFLYARPDDRFAEELPQAVNRAEVRANFLISMREDALARLDLFKGRIPYLFDNYLRIDRLDLEAARRAIEEPLKKWAALGGDHVTAERELVDAVLAEVRPDLSFGQLGAGAARDAARPDQIETTFLQLVLTRLWRDRTPGASKLTLQKYDDLRRARGIVRAHVNEGLAALSAEERAVAAEVFRFLVTKSGQKIAHNAIDLAGFVDGDEATVAQILTKLSEPGVSILRRVDAAPGREAAGRRYEIYHDTLAEAILEWRASQVDKQHRAAAEERVREQLRREAQRRRRRNLRIAAAGALGVAAIVIGFLLWFSIREGHISDSRRLAANALSILPADPAESLRIAAASLRKRDTREAETALRQSLIEFRVRGIFSGRGSTVTNAAFTPDGDRVIVTSKNGDVRVWALRGRARPIVQMKGDPGWSPAISPDGRRVIVERYGMHTVWDIGAASAQRAPRRVAVFRQGGLGTTPTFSADGRLLATTENNSVSLWRVNEQRKVARLAFARGIVYDVAFSHDGRLVAAVTNAGGGAIWTTAKPHARRTLSGHTGEVHTIEFSPDDRYVVTAGADGTARVWDGRTGAPRHVLTSGGDEVDLATFNRGGSLLLMVAKKTARVWRTGSWTPIAIRQNTDWVTAAAFSPDGDRVLTAGRDGTVWVWGAHSGETLFQLRGHTDGISSAEFSPDGNLIVTVGDDGTARIWDATTGLKLPVVGHSIQSAAFSADGRRVAVSNSEGKVLVFQRRRLLDPVLLRAGKEPVSRVTFSPYGRRLATASWDNTARIFDLANPRAPARILDAHRGAVVTAAFSPDGRRLVTASVDRTARIWFVRGGGSRILGRHPDIVAAAAFSPDGRRVVTACWDGKGRVWDADARPKVKPLLVLRGHRGGVTSAVYSADGRSILTTSLDKTARLWDARSGELRRIFRGHTAPVWDGEFSADGTLVVTAGADETTRIWDAKTGDALAVLHWNASLVNTAVFDPKDRYTILTASDDGSAKIGRCETCGGVDALLRLAKQRGAMTQVRR